MKTFQQFIETKQSEFSILKKNKKPLEDDEKKQAMNAGCVWHFTDNR